MSVEGDVSFWKWLAGGVTSAAAGLFGYHKYIDSKIAGKADKNEVTHAFQRVEDELARSRDVQAKLFDHQRENEQRAQDRYERLMERLTERKP
jgi:hypothetical protein